MARNPSKSSRHLIALIHGWIGVVASLFIFMIAATGLVLAFLGELFELEYGDMLLAEDGQHRHFVEIVEAAENNHPPGFQTLAAFMPDTRVENLETALVYGFEPGNEEIMLVSVDPTNA
ncbi:MAG: PepSY-associated TM helix domain-containing protein [Pseudomonadota bacterium]